MSVIDIRNQSTDEWLADYDGTGYKEKSTSSQIINMLPMVVSKNQSHFLECMKKIGVTSVRMIGKKLLIKFDRPLTADLDNRVRLKLQRLAAIAEQGIDESLYEYSEYRTFFAKNRPYIAVVFKVMHTGAIAERYFNIQLEKAKDNKSFKTGKNCEFRVKGSTKRLQEGMFLKFWMDSVKEIPEGKFSHIYRYMNSRLSGVVVSCSDTDPHHGMTKLHKLKYEGRVYQVT